MARGQDLEVSGRRSRLPAPLPLLRPASDRPTESLRDLFLRRWPGRLLLGALALKALLWIVDALVGANAVTAALGTVARIGLLVSLGVLRLAPDPVAPPAPSLGVRQRLIISYIFIGVVPALLIVAFFLFGAALMFFNVSAYLFNNGVNDIVDEARTTAHGGGRGDRASAAACSGATADPGAAVREQPGPLSRACRSRWCRGPPSSAAPTAGGIGPLTRWRVGAHGSAGDDSDVGERGRLRRHARLRAVERHRHGAARRPRRRPALGARSRSGASSSTFRSTSRCSSSIHQHTGVEPGDISLQRQEGEVTRPIRVGAPQRVDGANRAARADRHRVEVGAELGRVPRTSSTGSPGRPERSSMSIRVSPRDIYERHLVGAEPRSWGRASAKLTLIFLGFIGVLFLVIESRPSSWGWRWRARSRGSVHALFYGTERAAARRLRAPHSRSAAATSSASWPSRSTR